MRRVAVTLTVAALGVAGLLLGLGHTGRGGDVPDPWPLAGATRFSAEESAGMRVRTEAAVASCMRQAGFRYVPVPAGRPGRGTPNPYGLLSVQQARADGYGLTRTAFAGAGGPDTTGVPPDRAEAWQRALTGTPAARTTVRLPDGVTVSFSTDGCVFRSDEKVFGAGWTRRHYVVQALANLVVQRTLSGDAHRTAVRAWSACMTAAGRDATDLTSPPEQVRAQLASVDRTDGTLRRIGAAETELAVTDATCQKKVDLAAAVARAQADAESTLTPADRAEVAAFIRQRRNGLG